MAAGRCVVSHRAQTPHLKHRQKTHIKMRVNPHLWPDAADAVGTCSGATREDTHSRAHAARALTAMPVPYSVPEGEQGAGPESVGVASHQ
eukprot:77239-Chlamydomonas_euryale.AAC.2